MKKKILSIAFALVLLLSFSLIPAVPAAGVDGYDLSLTLENKDSTTWVVITDNISGLLEFNSSGPEFEYSFSATGLTASTEYSLIYYADKPDRFVDWGGDNPGALIATFTADESGNITPTAGSVELEMSLPCEPDANISEYDYTDPAVQDPPYATAHGAKIWLVPSSDYTEPALTAWNPSQYLFETDLITYTDTGVIVPPGGSASAGTDSANITANAGPGEGATVELTEYTAPPAGEPVFGALGTYVDVHCDTPENLTEVIIKVSYDDTGMSDVQELALRMSYWNSVVGDWRQCSDQGVDIANNFIWARIRDDTTPDLSYLATSIFGAGTVTMELDDWYTSGDTVDVTIEDAAKSGLIAAFAWSDTVHPEGKITFALTETGTGTGIFEGSFDLVSTTPGAGELLVNDGDQIFVAYMEVVGTATVDNVAPTIAIVSPAASANITENKPLIAATYTDADSAVDNATAGMTVDTKSVTPDTRTVTEITYTPSVSANLSDGSHTVTVDVKDLAGNAALQKIWSFTVDTIAPAITGEDVTPGTVKPDIANTLVFTATVTDATSGVANVTIDLSNIDEGTLAMTADDSIYTANVTTTIADEGDYILTITATDEAGKESTAEVTLVVSKDIISPVINSLAITYLYGDSVPPGDTVTISANVTDNLAVQTVQAACDAFETTPIDLANGVGDIYTVEAEIAAGTPWGDYTVTITATDTKANAAIPVTANLTVVSGATGYEIELVEGWNLVSLPLIPDSDNISVVISAANLASANVSNVAGIRAYDPATGLFPYYDPDLGSGDLATMEDGVGYWVFMDVADTLTVTGRQWPVPPAIPPVYPVVEGWNLIGVKDITPIYYWDYLSNLYDFFDYDFSVVWGYDAEAGRYFNVFPLGDGDEEYLFPGSGYWLWMKVAGTIVPPQ